MKIRTKLISSFSILIILIICVGYIGIKAIYRIRDNHILASKVSYFLYIQMSIGSQISQLTTISELPEFNRLKEEFEKTDEEFHHLLRELSSNKFKYLTVDLSSLITTSNMETVGEEILEIHKKKLEENSIFKKNYPLEKQTRIQVRNVIFVLNTPLLLKDIGNVQYFSKEVLYQTRDEKHFQEWLGAIKQLKSNIQKSRLPITKTEKQDLIKNIESYEQIAKIMGKIAINAKNIELQEKEKNKDFNKLISKSKKTNKAIQAYVTSISKKLLENIIFAQIIFITLLICCAFLLSTYISRSIMDSIKDFKQGVKYIIEGNYNVKVELKSKNEFIGLANTFNKMAAELSHAKEMLDNYNKKLEQKVEERTDELNKAMQNITSANKQLSSLSSKLSKYLSPQVYNSIFSGENKVELVTHRKKLTVFFSDIKSFTEKTDRMEPEVLSELLNSYLDEMAQIALNYGGTIDKFIGDAIMIFFGDPESKGDKEDALACVKMAIAMRERMKFLQTKWGKNGITQPLKIRMGINSGYCTVGNFGSETRMDYTVIGGQVNLASRLESHAKLDQIYISEETYILIKDVINCTQKETITVKGIAYPVQTYEVLDEIKTPIQENNLLCDEFPGFSLSIDLEQTNKTKAVETLTKIIKKVKGDKSS